MINANNDIAFIGTLKGTGLSSAGETGLWWGAPAAPVLLARSGAAATDEDGAVTTAQWANFVSIALPDGRMPARFCGKTHGWRRHL